MGRPLIIPSQRTDWCTPGELCDLIYWFFGGYPSLDPCGAPGQVVKANRVLFAPEHDGLRYHWRGDVYCNPPYGRGIEAWFAKALESRHEANTLMLVPAATSTNYWHELVFGYATGICFLRGRVRFVDGRARADLAPSVAGFANAFVYYGKPTRGRFSQVFSRAGYVLVAGEDGT